MAAGFISALRFEDHDGLPFTLIAPLSYVTLLLSAEPMLITVPQGFATDMASIPRGLWNVLPPVGSYDRPAVVHDFLYQHGDGSVSRAEADAVFREAMEVVGVGWWARQTIYWGVRLGGWRPWNRYRAQEKT